MRILDASNQVIEAALRLQYTRMYIYSHPHLEHGTDLYDAEEQFDVAVDRYTLERERERWKAG